MESLNSTFWFPFIKKNKWNDKNIDTKRKKLGNIIIACVNIKKKLP